MALERTITTADEAAEDVFSALVTAGVKAAISLSGAIYINNRPLNSVKEDIVVTTLAMSADQMQEGVLNVNIHVPNLVITNDTTQPNRVRLNAIARACISVIASYWGTDFNFEVEEPGTIVKDGANWFSNIRVRYYHGREDI